MYWLVIPKYKRRKCIFKVSCSNYVFKKTKEEGFISGYKALKKRIKSCRPGYNVIDIEGQTHIITADNNLHHIADMRDDIF